jgi:hypothetical protein
MPQRKQGWGERYIVAYGMITLRFKTPWKEVRILVVAVLPRLEHNMGDTRSVYTSWTTDPALATERAGPGGVVLQQTFPASRLVTSPDLFGEGEVLVTGPVRGASVTPIPKP